MNTNIDLNSLSLGELYKLTRLASETYERRKKEEKEKAWENLWGTLLEWIRVYGEIPIVGAIPTEANGHFTIAIDEKCCLAETGKIFY